MLARRARRRQGPRSGTLRAIGLSGAVGARQQVPGSTAVRKPPAAPHGSGGAWTLTVLTVLAGRQRGDRPRVGPGAGAGDPPGTAVKDDACARGGTTTGGRAVANSGWAATSSSTATAATVVTAVTTAALARR